MKKFDRITPEGTRDFLFEEYELLKNTENDLEELFKSAGYHGVKTPALEFFDVFSGGVGELSQENIYTTTDNNGRLVVLRPDSTKPVARLVSSRLKNAKLPLRLFYNQCTYRRNKSAKLLSDEIRQTGIELIGEGGMAADIEALLLAAKCLKKTCGDSFVIEIGHTGFFKELIASLDVSNEIKSAVRKYVEAKNYPALDLLLQSCNACQKTVSALKMLPTMYGGIEILDKAAEFLFSGTNNGFIDGLMRLYSAMLKEGFGDNIFIDLGLVNGYEYYSGLVFKGYTGGRGEAVLSGGRYDTLYNDYDMDIPAIGFAINTELLLFQKDGKSRMDGGKKLTVALTKGRLEDSTCKLLEKAGVDCSPLKNKGRKLIVSLDGGKLCGSFDVVFAKAADVITFVQRGVCDIGVVGKDTIMELGESFYEMLNLGFGKCRFALAAKKGSDFYGGYNVKTIATKYPNVARAYFESKEMDVEIVKIEGSVELAPLLSLADGIVDIVETGSTLKENGLEVVEYISDISARVIVNIASLKMKKQQIEGFIDLLKGAL